MTGVDVMCQSNEFLLKWRIFVEVTDFGSWKEVVFVWK